MDYSEEKYRILKEYFGHTEFRPGQETIIDSLYSGKDVLCIMPTGAGKSMCYQIPAIMYPGVTIVISPLISLMQDQVDSLTQIGVRAAYVNSSLTVGQYNRVLRLMADNVYKIVYVAPERLENEGFLAVCRAIEVSMVAVDEAHCVSHWGQDFRPSYLKISEFVEKFPKRPVIGAFTATATEKVKHDMEKLLELKCPTYVTTGFDRPNLFFTVITPKTRVTELMKIVAERHTQSGIIYCSTRKNVEKICDILTENGHPATRYHGGLSEYEKKKNQDDFVFDRIPIMVATNAFGMGIDKSNVSYVIHFNMPKDLESYYQEAGRAGRDGNEAECILMYSPQDIKTAKFFISSIDSNPDLTDEAKEHLKQCEERRLKFMILYCTTNECLRWFLLRYFGERGNCRCGKCSNCVSNYQTSDVTIEAQKILSCIIRTNQRYGVKMIVDVLRGVGNSRITNLGFDSISTYGIMKEYSEDKIRAIVNSLVFQGYINTSDDSFLVLSVDRSATAILKGNKKVSARLLKETKFEVNKTADDADINTGLLMHLKTLRKDIAQRASVPAYVVFTDATLKDMCRKKPQNLIQFASVSGVGAAKLEKYGGIFLKAIGEYEEHNSEKQASE